MSAVLDAPPRAGMVSGEYEFEATPGLPEPLPPGERILWQGAPDWWRLARESLHWRKLAIYFGILLAWRGASVAADGASLMETAAAVAGPLLLALLALGLVAFFGWLLGRTSLYTITDQRVVLRVGIVLTLSFNLPYRRIESADLRASADGHGDIALTLAGDDRIAYVHLWPHARPWHLKRTQPMLRALPDAQHVAQVLRSALLEFRQR